MASRRGRFSSPRATLLLDVIAKEKRIRARGVYGFFRRPRDRRRRRAVRRRGREAARFHFLRQQAAKDGHPGTAAGGDFVAPVCAGLTDYIGGFAVTTGHGLNRCRSRPARRLQRDSRRGAGHWLAEAFAEYMHELVRRQWGYGRDEGRDKEQLIREEYRGTARRPVTPPVPITPRRARCWSCSTWNATPACTLTNSFAMWPGSSVSGLYCVALLHRRKLGRDQLLDYHARKGMTLSEASAGWDPTSATNRPPPATTAPPNDCLPLPLAGEGRGEASRSRRRPVYFLPASCCCLCGLLVENAATTRAARSIAISLAHQASMLSTKHFWRLARQPGRLHVRVLEARLGHRK